MRKIKKIFLKNSQKILIKCSMQAIYDLIQALSCSAMFRYAHVFYSPDLTWGFLTLFDLKILIITRNGFKNDCDDKMTTK